MKEKLKKIQKLILENKTRILIFLLILIGILIRTVNISEIPNALNVDEASAGYEAYSILNYGMDRNRKS